MNTKLRHLFLWLSILILAVALSGSLAQSTDTFSALGFDTSASDLQDVDDRSVNQPFGNRNIRMFPVSEFYSVLISDTQVTRALVGDDEAPDLTSQAALDFKYIKAVAVDAQGTGLEQSVVELGYLEDNGGELYLSLKDPRYPNVKLGEPILVFSNDSQEPLITDYRNEHSFLTVSAADFDNDGLSEIIVFIPDAQNPRIALYQIVDGVIQDSPDEVFAFEQEFSKYVYMDNGDLTGDNVADLVVSYNVKDDSYYGFTNYLYVFKSQGFSLYDPHWFARLNGNGAKPYYSSPVPNAGVVIADTLGKDRRNELVLGSSKKSDGETCSTMYSMMLGYLYEDGRWDFGIRTGFSETEKSVTVGHKWSNNNALTVIEAVDVNHYRGALIYLNGVITTLSVDIDGFYNHFEPYFLYVDYDAVTGNFTNDDRQREQLKVLREKFSYNAETGAYDKSEGFEIVTYVGEVGLEGGPGFTIEPVGDPGTVSGAMAKPNTDNDTIIMRYKGHGIVYSDPTILAVIASPPYFGDLAHMPGGEDYIGGCSTEFTTGSGGSVGGSVSNTITASAYFSLTAKHQFSVVKGIFEMEVETTHSWTWDKAHEKEVSTSITYGTVGGQDSVAVYTIPMDVYTYEAWIPERGNQPGYWQTMQQYFPYPAEYVVLPVDTYDAIAKKSGLIVIGDKIFSHTLGKPETYPSSSEEMYQVKDPVENTIAMGVGYGSAYTSQSIEITSSTTQTRTYTGGVSVKLGGGAEFGDGNLEIKGGVGIGYEGSKATVVSSFENAGFTGTVANMPLEAQPYGYGYQWKLVAYSFTSRKEDYPAGSLHIKEQSFPVLYYTVPVVRRPPMLPEGFEVAGTTSDSITFRWENQDPSVTGYSIFRYYDFDSGINGYYPVSDVLSTGTSTFTDIGLLPYSTYLYKMQVVGYPYNMLLKELVNSIMSAALSARTAPDKNAPTIRIQPVDSAVSAGGVAKFQIIADPAAAAAATERLFYCWQRLNADGRWVAVQDGSDCTLSIIGVNDGHEGLYRCAVSQLVGSKAITIYSDQVLLAVDRNRLSLSLQIDEVKPGGLAELGKSVTLSSHFVGLQGIKPSGKVHYQIVFYPEAMTELGSSTLVAASAVEYLYSAAINSSGAVGSVKWTPDAYGSYEVRVIYNGDQNYHQSLSDVKRVFCAESEHEGLSALSITGLDNGYLLYGEQVPVGAWVVQNGAVRSLNPEEISFRVISLEGSPADGMSVMKTEGADASWFVEANRAGSYDLEVTSDQRVIRKMIIVHRKPIAIKVTDQERSLNAENESFTFELISGSLKAGDTLDALFDVDYQCSALKTSAAGEYPIFIQVQTQHMQDRYELISVEKGTLRVRGLQYRVQLKGVSNGTVSALVNGWSQKPQNSDPGYLLDAGCNVRFIATPQKGYTLEKWVVNGKTIYTDETKTAYDTAHYFTISSLTGDMTVEAYFVPLMCEVTYASTGNGTVLAMIGQMEVGNGANIPAETTLALQASPAEGYMVTEWLINGKVLEGYYEQTHYVTVTGNTHIEVRFGLKELRVLTYSVSGNGSLEARKIGGQVVASGDSVIKGTTVNLTAVPMNSIVKEWVVNGKVVQGNQNQYQISQLHEDTHIEVVFVPFVQYRVQYGAIGLGTTGMTAAASGDFFESGALIPAYSDILFTAEPPEGYTIKAWRKGSEIINGANGTPWLGNQFTLKGLSSTVNITVEYGKSQLIGLVSPTAISGLNNGTQKTEAGLALPANVRLLTDTGSAYGAVTWSVSSCSYNPALTTEQRFIVSGTVQLPQSVLNDANVPLIVQVDVTVKAVSTSTGSTDTGTSAGSGGGSGGMTILTQPIPLATPLKLIADPVAGTVIADIEQLQGTIFGGATPDAEIPVYEVPAMPGGRVYGITLPGLLLTGVEEGAFILKTPVGMMTIPADMLKETPGATNDKVQILMALYDGEGLTESLKEQIGNRPIVSLSVKLGDQPIQWNGGSASVTVAIPYTPTQEELMHPNHIVVWYIDGSGAVVSIPNGRYDQATGQVLFTTNHFSLYAVGYNYKSFNDLGQVEWARQAIEAMAARKIINGISQNIFSPTTRISRADFVVLLIKTLGLQAQTNDSFKDVNLDAYYYGAVAAAKALGIINGGSDGLFNPSGSITRQDMMAMTARALNLARSEARTVNSSILDRYADRKDIAPYAIGSIASLVQEGYITGADGKIHPLASTTRAEAAVFLYRILMSHE